MSKLAERYGPWAVVTGASAGIGAEFALRIAELGINVVLIARRRNRLEELASTIEDMYRVQARVAPVDLASRDVVQVLQPVLADIDVGQNIGARLQADQAEADVRVARAKAEERRAMATAREQEMRAAVARNRSKVVLAEAEVPQAMSAAFREGNLQSSKPAR